MDTIIAILFCYMIQFVFFTAIRIMCGLYEEYSFTRRIYLTCIIPAIGVLIVIIYLIAYAFRKD